MNAESGLSYLQKCLGNFLTMRWLDFAHQIVQAIAIVVIAIFLFVLSRVFVFARQPAGNGVIRS